MEGNDRREFLALLINPFPPLRCVIQSLSESPPRTRTARQEHLFREAFRTTRGGEGCIYLSKRNQQSISRDVVANADMISRKWSGMGRDTWLLQKWHNLSTYTYIHTYVYMQQLRTCGEERERERERHMAAKRPLRIARGTIEIGYRAGIPSEY